MSWPTSTIVYVQCLWRKNKETDQRLRSQVGYLWDNLRSVAVLQQVFFILYSLWVGVHRVDSTSSDEWGVDPRNWKPENPSIGPIRVNPECATCNRNRTPHTIRNTQRATGYSNVWAKYRRTLLVGLPFYKKNIPKHWGRCYCVIAKQLLRRSL
jgi:hypothetical protein